MQTPWLIRVLTGHKRLVCAVLAGLLSYPLLPRAWDAPTRSVLAWDVGALVFLALAAILFGRGGSGPRMAANAEAQQEGEWTMFWVTLAGVSFSFVALTGQLSAAKDAHAVARTVDVAITGGTLLLSWLATQIEFAYRYAHEYYSRSPGAPKVDGGLDFPGDEPPDYWDFVYFSMVLGMTFQVSDVQITSRPLRRLATVQGLIGFLFNTVIIALTVNIAAGLL